MRAILLLLALASPAAADGGWIVVDDYVLAIDWCTLVTCGDNALDEPVARFRYIVFWDWPEWPRLFPRIRDWRWLGKDRGLKLHSHGGNCITFLEESGGRTVCRRVHFLFEWVTTATYDLEVANRCFYSTSERRLLTPIGADE